MALPIKWVGASDNYTPGRSQTVDLIVLHWMVGTLASADATFTNPARDASAHYGLNGSEIHQYVKETDTAWANGHSNPAKNTNPRSISIEHEGGWMTPSGVRFKPTPETHEMSARLIADIVSRRQNIKHDRNHIKLHKEVSDSGTECPGTLDIDWIINRAKQLLGGQEMNIWPDKINPMQVKLRNPVRLWDIPNNRDTQIDSGLEFVVNAKVDVNDNPYGSSFYIPTDRTKDKEAYGFREEEIGKNGTMVELPTPPPAIDLTEQQRKDLQTGEDFRTLVNRQ